MIKVKPQSCVQQLIVSDLVVSGSSYHTRAALSCDMRPHKQTRSDTSSCSTHSCGFPIMQAFLSSMCNTLSHLKTWSNPVIDSCSGNITD